MNGVHDLGGMDGFGPVIPEPNEPVFHEPWEGRVFALNMLGIGRDPIPVDALRHRIERLDPRQYLTSTYYERWLAEMEQAIIDAGTLTPDQIDARMRELEAEPDRPLPRTENPEHADGVASALRAGSPVTRKTRRQPRFTLGDRVLTRNLHPHGHTRLPRYVRGKRGVVMLHHGAHVFPDTNAHGLGEHPQHLYTVRFAARELWSDAAEQKESILIDLWESYLQPDSEAKASSRVKAESAPKAKPAPAIKAAPKAKATAEIKPKVSPKLQHPARAAASIASKGGKSKPKVKR
jgi:nitrile hydratase beta subunit